MIQRTFDELVTDLRMRRTVGDKPPVLLLGAGASISRYIDTTTAAERYRFLAEFLQTRRPSEISPGYQALASLCAQNYFDLVLTTNMDPLLDDALSAAQLWRRDCLLIVNGVIRPDRLSLLGGQSPRVKIVKLDGDLFQRFMAWTVPEMDTFLTEVAPHLAPAVAGPRLHRCRLQPARPARARAGGIVRRVDLVHTPEVGAGPLEGQPGHPRRRRARMRVRDVLPRTGEGVAGGRGRRVEMVLADRKRTKKKNRRKPTRRQAACPYRSRARGSARRRHVVSGLRRPAGAGVRARRARAPCADRRPDSPR